MSTFEGLNPYSIKDANDALSKRQVQKKEKRIFDMLPESQMTFKEPTDWYLKLEKVKTLASYDIIKIKLGIFNADFGDRLVSDIKPNERRKGRHLPQSNKKYVKLRPWYSRLLTTI